MSFKTEKLGEPLAEGTEKVIYHHPNDPEKVVAEFRNDEDEPIQMKGRYYLTKILHVLFPKNIPDISLVQHAPGQKSQMVLEKKHLDPTHEALRDQVSHLQSKINAGEADPDLESDITSQEVVLIEKLDADPAFLAFKRGMREAGLRNLFDDTPRNFGYDKEGNLVYIDNSFLPWAVSSDGEIEPKDYQKLYEAIQKLDDKDKERAMVYFDRLETLRQEAAMQAKQGRSIEEKEPKQE